MDSVARASVRTAHCASTDSITEGRMVDGAPAQLNGILNIHVPA